MFWNRFRVVFHRNLDVFVRKKKIAAATGVAREVEAAGTREVTSGASLVVAEAGNRRRTHGAILGANKFFVRSP